METIEGEVVNETPRAALVVRQDSQQVAQWTPSFALGIDEAVERVEAKHQFFRRVMRENDHYGVIPGTKTKPTLLKPGAELLLASMGLHAEFADEDAPEIDVMGTEHGGEAYIRYRRQCSIYRQTGTMEHEKMLIARASGSCSSWENKYRYRNGERVCPACGKAAIIKGKAEYGGGWLCFGKKGGCGAKYDDDDRAIASQDTGKIPNPDIADIENTILKMADKRALVAATLIATGCSDIFTQDIEDMAVAPAPAAPPPRTPEERFPSAAEVRALYAKARAAVPGLPDDVKEWATANIAGFDAARPTKGMLVAIDAALRNLLAAGASVAQGAPAQAVAAQPSPEPQAAPESLETAKNAQMTDATRKHLMGALNRIGVVSKPDRLAFAAARGFTVASYSELTEEQARILAEDATNEARCPACGTDDPAKHQAGCPEGETL